MQYKFLLVRMNKEPPVNAIEDRVESSYSSPILTEFNKDPSSDEIT